MRLKTHEEMFNIFCKDSLYMGSGIYSMWAPGGRILAEDTADLFKQFLARFDKSDDMRYDLDTVKESVE